MANKISVVEGPVEKKETIVIDPRSNKVKTRSTDKKEIKEALYEKRHRN